MSAPATVVLAAAVLGALVVLGLHLRAHVFLAGAIVLAVFAGSSGHLGLPIGPERVALLAGLAALAWGLDREERVVRGRFRTEHALMVLLAVLAAVSSTLAGSLTADGFRGGFALLDRLSIVAFVLFAVAPLAFRDARTRNTLLVALVGLGAYLGFTSLMEGFGIDGLVFPGYIVDPEVGIHQTRARGPMTESAGFGLALFDCAVAAVLAARTWRRPSARVLAAVVAVTCLFGLLFTLTRAVWLGALVATGVVLVLRPGWAKVVVPAVAAVGVAVVLSIVASPGIEERVTDRAGNEGPVWDRINLADAGMRAVEEEPLFGIGWREFNDRGEEYFRQRPGIPQSGGGLDVHNVVLSVAAELGLVGAALWCAVVALTLGRAVVRVPPPELRDWHVALVAMAVQFVVVAMFTPFSYPFTFFLLWAWSGILLADRITWRGPVPTARPLTVATTSEERHLVPT